MELVSIITPTYAAWDFDGEPGWRDLEALVLIDGAPFGAFSAFVAGTSFATPWQTVAEARTLYVEQSIARERRDFLAHAREIYALAAQHSQSAQAAGNATLEQTSADLAVLQDVGSRLGDAERSLLTAQQELHALLGIDPSVTLPLQSLAPPSLPSSTASEQVSCRLLATSSICFSARSTTSTVER